MSNIRELSYKAREGNLTGQVFLNIHRDWWVSGVVMEAEMIMAF